MVGIIGSCVGCLSVAVGLSVNKGRIVGFIEVSFALGDVHVCLIGFDEVPGAFHGTTFMV